MVVLGAFLMAFLLFRMPDTGGEVPPMASAAPVPAASDGPAPAGSSAAVPTNGAAPSGEVASAEPGLARPGAAAKGNKIEGVNEVAAERARMRAESPEIQVILHTQSSWTEITRRLRANGDTALADEIKALSTDLMTWSRQPDPYAWPDLLARQQALVGTAQQSAVAGEPSVQDAITRINEQLASLSTQQ
jgi:hypothetical protein